MGALRHVLAGARGEARRAANVSFVLVSSRFPLVRATMVELSQTQASFSSSASSSSHLQMSTHHLLWLSWSLATFTQSTAWPVRLARSLRYEDSIICNVPKAVQLYQLAAGQGYADAQVHEMGIGVEADMNKAIALYRLAADQGHAQARCSLGCCFTWGSGISQDFSKAAELFQLAARSRLCARSIPTRLPLRA